MTSMYYTKVIDEFLYLVHKDTKIEYKVVDNLFETLSSIPDITIQNIKSIKVYSNIVVKNNTLSNIRQQIISYEKDKNSKVLYSTSRGLYYGNPLHNPLHITNNLLLSMIRFPSLKLEDKIFSVGEIYYMHYSIVTKKLDYVFKIIEDLSIRIGLKLSSERFYYIGNSNDLHNTTFKDFFIFRNKVFYGNILECKYPDRLDKDLPVIFKECSVEKINGLRNLILSSYLKNKDHLYQVVALAINKSISLTNEEKDILKKYSELNLKHTNIYNEDFYKNNNIEFFKKICVKNSFFNLFELFEYGFGSIENIRETISELV